MSLEAIRTRTHVTPDSPRLRYEMHRHGFTVRSLGKAAGVNVATVNHALHGRPIRTATLAKIARALAKAKVVDGGLLVAPAPASQIEQE